MYRWWFGSPVGLSDHQYVRGGIWPQPQLFCACGQNPQLFVLCFGTKAPAIIVVVWDSNHRYILWWFGTQTAAMYAVVVGPQPKLFVVD